MRFNKRGPEDARPKRPLPFESREMETHEFQNKDDNHHANAGDNHCCDKLGRIFHSGRLTAKSRSVYAPNLARIGTVAVR
jgi:hypothetical protein